MPHYEDATITLHHGDCLDVLRSLPDASVDAVVTDPPYSLRFMGRAWDAHENPAAFQAWCELWATECLRVLKPGAHLLAFGGTRTSHRLACAVEDAGFEIRDSIAWLYGSGFPKSLDVSKAIDRAATVNDETLRRIAAVAEVIRAHREAAGLTRAEVSDVVVGTPSGACWNWEHQQLPSVEMWPAIKRTLSIPDKFDGLIEGDRAKFIAAEREVTGMQRGAMSGWSMDGSTRFVDREITAPATPDAERWQGWGTALKPAHEPIVVARKPLAGTVAGNVLTHGTGALNVDGCRVATSDALGGGAATKGSASHAEGWDRPWKNDPEAVAAHAARVTANVVKAEALGRWPANVILDESQAEVLDAQSGTLQSGANPTRRGSDKFRDAYGDFAGQEECEPARGADTGGASRFFYVAKADASERVRVDGIAHPTVKPLALMRWLVRLVTPPGGTVLEPFAGSGTTVEACILEGFRCVAIEREADYLPLIVQRIHRRRDPVEAVRGSGEDGGLFDLLDGGAA